MEELMSMDVDFEMPYTEEEMRRFSAACSFMKISEFDKAITLFCDHIRTLMAKREICSGDKKKMDALDTSLELVASYLQECRKSSLNKTLDEGWVPVTDDIEKAVEPYEPMVRETLQRILTFPVADVTWENTPGMMGAKKHLTRWLLGPLKSGSLYESEESRMSGCLLFGQSGMGKTYVAYGLLNEVKHMCTILVIESGTLLSKWSGTPQKLVDGLFRFAEAASPCLIVMDECDQMFQDRDSKTKETSEALRHWQNSMLGNWDRPRSKNCRIYILAMSNLPWSIDRAFQRRLNYKVFVPPPNMKERRAILEKFVGKNNNITDDDWISLVEQTKQLTISGLKDHVHFSKDKVQESLKETKFWIQHDIPGEGLKWCPCPKEYGGAAVERNFVNFTNTYTLQLRFEDLSLSDKVKKGGTRTKESWRKRMRVSADRLKLLSGIKTEESYSQQDYDTYMKKEKCFQ